MHAALLLACVGYANAAGIITGPTGMLLASFPAGTSPYKLAMDSTGVSLWVANFNDLLTKGEVGTVTFVPDDGGGDADTMKVGANANPTFLAVDAANERVWFTDAQNGRAIVFDDSVRPPKQLAAFPIGDQYASAQGVAVDAQGRAWIANMYASEVVLVTSTGTVVKRVALKNPGGTPVYPLTVNIDLEGAVWVTTENTNCVFRVDAVAYTTTLFTPLYCAVTAMDGLGNLWAIGTSSDGYPDNVVYKLTNGAVVVAVGGFNNPVDIKVDMATNHVYVLSNVNSVIAKLDQTGALLGAFVACPSSLGCDNVALELSAAGIYVSDDLYELVYLYADTTSTPAPTRPTRAPITPSTGSPVTTSQPASLATPSTAPHPAKCKKRYAHATVKKCVRGLPSLECAKGYVDCDLDVFNGCETKVSMCAGRHRSTPPSSRL